MDERHRISTCNASVDPTNRWGDWRYTNHPKASAFPCAIRVQNCRSHGSCSPSRIPVVLKTTKICLSETSSHLFWGRDVDVRDLRKTASNRPTQRLFFGKPYTHLPGSFVRMYGWHGAPCFPSPQRKAFWVHEGVPSPNIR